MEQIVGCELLGKSDVLGESLPQSRFVHHKSQVSCPGIKPGPLLEA
jgi:hypothetical protein